MQVVKRTCRKYHLLAVLSLKSQSSTTHMARHMDCKVCHAIEDRKTATINRSDVPNSPHLGHKEIDLRVHILEKHRIG